MLTKSKQSKIEAMVPSQKTQANIRGRNSDYLASSTQAKPKMWLPDLQYASPTQAKPKMWLPDLQYASPTQAKPKMWLPSLTSYDVLQKNEHTIQATIEG